MNYIGRIGAISVVVLLSTYYAVSYYLHYGELTVFEFSGDIVYIALAWWGGNFFDKARVLAKKLQRKQQELQNILEYNVDAVVIRDLEGNILEVNPAYEKMIGYTKEEVVNKLVPFIKGREEDVKKLIQDVVKKGELSGFEVVREKKNGELIYSHTSLSLLQDENGSPERVVGIWRDITEQKKDECALRESEERYRTLIEFCPDAIIVHAEGNIVFTNKAGLELFGACHEEELLGKRIWDFVDKVYWESVEDRIKSVHETNSVSTLLEERMIGLDGRIIYGEVATMPITYMSKQANQVIIRDITDKKRMENILRENDEQLRRIMDNITDLLVQSNERFQFEYISPACSKILGYEPDELIGFTILELVHPDDIENVKKGVQKIMNKDSHIKLEYRYRHKNGYYIWLESLSSALFDEQTGKIKSYIFVSRNITDRKDAEELIHKQDKLLQGVSKATNLLLTISKYKTAIEQTLSTLGHTVDADRVCIFENQQGIEDHPVVSLRFEWAKEMVGAQIDNPLFQNFSYRKNGFTRWYDELSCGGIINDAVKDCPDSERRILEMIDIQSLLAVPIFIQGTYWGYITFDDCTKARRWSKNEKTILLVAASGIGGAIERKQREMDLQEALTEKEISEQKLKEMNEILKQHSSLDGLTGIANRRYFDEYLGQEWNKAVKHEDLLSLIMLDIDFFKKYNDTYGHLGGDECLKQVAGRIDKIVTQHGAVVARYGGEEFSVILPNTEREEAIKIAETIRAGIEELAIPHCSSDVSDVLTISVGMSTCKPLITLEPENLIESADMALYESKRLGRNQVSVCNF